MKDWGATLKQAELKNIFAIKNENNTNHRRISINIL